MYSSIQYNFTSTQFSKVYSLYKVKVTVSVYSVEWWSWNGEQLWPRPLVFPDCTISDWKFTWADEDETLNKNDSKCQKCRKYWSCLTVAVDTWTNYLPNLLTEVCFFLLQGFRFQNTNIKTSFCWDFDHIIARKKNPAIQIRQLLVRCFIITFISSLRCFLILYFSSTALV